jgi:hypothetical protein
VQRCVTRETLDPAIRGGHRLFRVPRLEPGLRQVAVCIGVRMPVCQGRFIRNRRLFELAFLA